MPVQDAERLVIEGLAFLEQGNNLAALASFERAVRLDNMPVYRAYHAFCIARERGQPQRAEEICREAVSQEPLNPLLYLNLGRVLLIAGRKPEAIEVFRQGLQCGDNGEIIRELNRIGTRRKPPIPFLRRENPVNKYLGMMLSRLGLR